MIEESEVLAKLPKGWEWATVAVIGEVVTGTTPSKSEKEYYGDDFPLFKPADLNNGFYVRKANDGLSVKGARKARLLPPKSVLVTCIGATIGKVGFIRVEGASNQQINAIIPGSNVLPEFIYFSTISPQFQKSILNNASATTLPILNKSRFEQLVLPLPPLAEQQRIVEEVEKQFTRLDAAVAALKRVQAQLKRYRASVLKAACEGNLVPTEAELACAEGRDYESAEKLLRRILKERRAKWEADQLAKMRAAGKEPKDDKWKEKYQEPAAPDANNLPDLPEGWTIASLEQLTSATRVICYGILMPKDNVSDGVLYVRVKDMKGDRIDLNALYRTSTEIAAAYARASLKPGDLLLAIRGTYGRIAEVPAELDGGNITQDTARLDISSQAIKSYIATCLRSPDVQNYFKRVARGVAVKGVNIADVRLTPILLPPPDEQRRIVAEVERRLSFIHEIESVISANLKRAAALRQSILKRAFEGKLVPQDPNDEPASVLLERIRAERASREAETKAAKPTRKKKPSDAASV